MFKFIKQACIALLSFSRSVIRVAKVSDHTKRLSLNNESCTARPTFFDLNLEQLSLLFTHA